MRFCNVRGCFKKHYARGLCENHYRIRMRRLPVVVKKVLVSSCDVCPYSLWIWSNIINCKMKEHEQHKITPDSLIPDWCPLEDN